jgi:putative transposase
MEYDEVLGIDWEWQSVDGAMTKSPFGGAATGGNPTDRGKVGVKRSLLTDADGIPLALFVDGAYRHDSKLLRLTVDATVITRRKPSRRRLQHLCLDKGYDYPFVDDADVDLRIRRPHQPPGNPTPQEEAWRKRAPLGCRAHSQLDQPFQTTTRSVGKEG